MYEYVSYMMTAVLAIASVISGRCARVYVELDVLVDSREYYSFCIAVVLALLLPYRELRDRMKSIHTFKLHRATARK